MSWLRNGVVNATEILRVGRLTAPHRTPFTVHQQGRIHSLRRYNGPEPGSCEVTLLLVPPLMVSSEIYDMAPELSAVSYLLGQSVDVWLVDFGAPEQIEGGLNRTLDDHILAVAGAIDFVCEQTGRDIHLAGYSQGGMFCYQAAAYRRNVGVASIVTFGSPVDIHQNSPFDEEITEAVIAGLRVLIQKPLDQMEALPGILTSIGFKLVSPRKELSQLFEFVAKLHDRGALEKRETRRRFLGGEGFVAWPGPALRTFIDEYIVNNRLASGGFVVDGRMVSLTDLKVPILSFVGLSDEIARPASVRAIRDAAFRAEVHEVGVPSGHLGLVVGTRSLEVSWPTVAQWLRWKQNMGPIPERLHSAPPIQDIDDLAFDELDLGIDDVFRFAENAVGDALGGLSRFRDDLLEVVDAFRWQLPRLNRLREITSDSITSPARILRERAQQDPDSTFFLWRGRAFSYRDADRRIDAIVRGLYSVGIRGGDRVGVLMGARPSYLSIVTALNRMGAVAILSSPDGARVPLRQAFEVSEARWLVTDPEHAEAARGAFDGSVLALGGPYGTARTLPAGVIDLEAIDPDAVALDHSLKLDEGRAKDVALVLVSAGNPTPRLARITNGRMAVSAYGTAATATLTPSDTVYCSLPLHHAAGIMVAVGGALVGGARLALAPAFEPASFWGEVRRYGVTVVFYAGEMARALVDAPPAHSEAQNPVRIFAGSGIRVDVWKRLQTRFGSGVLEFYASTEGNAVLANASGEKVGALGQPLPGAGEVALVAYDFLKQKFEREFDGHLRSVGVDEPGVLLARVSGGVQAPSERLVCDAFAPGDHWYHTGDVLRQDADGDYWFVDRLRDVIVRSDGPVFTRRVEDLLYRIADIRMVVVYGLDSGEGTQPDLVAAVMTQTGDPLRLERFSEFVAEKLRPAERPRFVLVIDDIPMTEGHRPRKEELRRRGLRGRAVYERVEGTYRLKE